MQIRLRHNNVDNSNHSEKLPLSRHTRTIIINPLLVFLILALIVSFALLTNNIILATNAEKEEVVEDFESNENTIDIMGILSQNVGSIKKQEIIAAEREMDYITLYKPNDNLPKDEEIIVQEGKKGKEQVSIVRTFENDELISENIISTYIIEQPTQEIVDVGTSEFLARYRVHIGDLLYLRETYPLKESMLDEVASVCTVAENVDVRLLEVYKDWCKVSFENYVGYIRQEKLTSEFLTPGISYECRKAKALSKLSITMDLTKSSGLTVEDFKKILANEPRDRNKILENNAVAFYNMEQKYNINGIFVLAIAIHESGWAASAIASDKKNLFGYGAYDESPYESAVTFNTYEEGIESVTKHLVKNYLNIKGVLISTGEVAEGLYYNGPTLSGVNVRYATDPEWHVKVYNTMVYLYEKL